MGVTSLPEEPYFVDFLRDAPEPTGNESDDSILEAPKIYEMVTYCTIRRIFWPGLEKPNDMLAGQGSPNKGRV